MKKAMLGGLLAVAIAAAWITATVAAAAYGWLDFG